MYVQILLKLFRKPRYLISLIVLTLFLFVFFIAVQIYFTPDYRAQPKLIFLFLKPKDYFLLITFAFLVAFNFIISVMKIKKIYFGVSGGVVSLFSSLLAGIVATAFCSSCLAALFSFLGTTTALGLTFFSLKYKTWIILGNFLFLGFLTFYNLRSLHRIANKLDENARNSSREGSQQFATKNNISFGSSPEATQPSAWRSPIASAGTSLGRQIDKEVHKSSQESSQQLATKKLNKNEKECNC